MWSQLAEMFGNAFLRENGDEPSPLWNQAVYRLTDEQIKNGLADLGNQGLSFPPNLSQFVEACKKPLSAKAPYWNGPKLEDQRKPGRMSRAEWMSKNETD